ncbi:MAG: hypothetical protein Q4F31_10290 [Eubacteriales bacterium]|nr:hypothetical protein [Eubacteriales bacterium]
MNTKEFFEQAYRINDLIDSKAEMIVRLRCRAENITSSLSPVRVQSSGSDRPMADMLDMMTDLEAEITEDSRKLCETLKSIIRVIQQISDPRYRLILEKHYILGLPFRRIGSEMGYSLSHVMKLHDEALLAAKIPEDA